MLAYLKHWIKKHFLILKVRPRLYPSVQLSQLELYHRYREMARNNTLPKFSETGFRVFSQFEEDGFLLYIFSLLGMTHKSFIEIGADDGVNSNSANLYFHHGWHGLFIDGNARSLARGEYFFRKYPHNWFYTPIFKQAYVTRENVNTLIGEAGFSGEIGLLSIDIDGNDYWVWDAVEVVKPQVVIIETHNEFGYRNIVVPYDAKYVFPGKHPLYHGASPIAMQLLGKKKGYRLVGSNQLASNFVFVRNGLLEMEIPEVDARELLTHPHTLQGMKEFKDIEHYEFVTPIPEI